MKPVEIRPAKGKLGILLVGLGAVSTTVIAGVLSIRKGLAKPIGSLTQMGTIRLGKRTEGRSPRIADVLPLARLITEDFLSGDYGRIDIVYSRFISTLAQRPVMVQLLPIQPTPDTEGIPGNQFIFEPSPAAVLEQLLPRYVATRLYQAVLEAKASEESSRMVAMKNATENAEELIDDLTLSYNKVRQANITREMIEIASGAQAR